MLGWINDCVEKLATSKFGLDIWHDIKQKAGCEVPDGGFYKLDVYTDKSTVDLVVAATKVLGVSTEAVLETFGAFFVEYVKDEGYENLLVCQGSNLKDFMANINAMHQHLQDTFPRKMSMPQFWVEDEEDGSLLLHYHSKRGSLLAPVAKGVIVEIASTQFGYAINMDRIRTQGDEGADFTSWRITTVDPKEMWKLTMKEEVKEGLESTPTSMKCPFTGMTFLIPASTGGDPKPSSQRGCPYSSARSTTAPPRTMPASSEYDANPSKKRKRMAVAYIQDQSQKLSKSLDETRQCQECRSEEVSDLESDSGACRRGSAAATPPARVSADESCSAAATPDGIGLNGTMTKSLFPYHVMVDSDFKIAQVGKKLPIILQSNERDLIGRDLADVFVLSRPGGIHWNWKWLQLLEGQAFEVEPKDDTLQCFYSFKTTVVLISDTPCMAMLIMTPEAHNLQELREMNLTFSDLPLHGAHRDSIFLREHLSSQMNSALKMEELSRSLEVEKSLLESMLPSHAAEGLRRGESVTPRLHNNVTFFFSDIVGFTKICSQLQPSQVIEMLNRLYCVMDALCKKFNLYKIETIGDAYVCASGLPKSDKDHAKNVANFAIAVSHCCKQAVSPVDGSPIQLRIGVHTGPCASGVVGSTNPRYCVFGDTVNTTARHESSGLPGKIHCSNTASSELVSKCGGSFTLQMRGLVEMKGKGKCTTFWLEPHESNELVNRAGLAKLDNEIKDLLDRTNFKTSVPRSESDVALEIQHERQRRLSILGDDKSQIQASMKEARTSSRSSMHRIGSLTRTFEAQERYSIQASGQLNIDWGHPLADKEKKQRARSGNSLLDAVDRCTEATPWSELPLYFP